MSANLEWKAPGSSGVYYALAILSTLFLSTLAAFIWAAFFRRRGGRRHHHRRHHSKRHPEFSPAPAATSAAAQPRPGHHHRRRRHRRRSEAARNPTLAETGGLPPIHTGGSEPFT